MKPPTTKRVMKKTLATGLALSALACGSPSADSVEQVGEQSSAIVTSWNSGTWGIGLNGTSLDAQNLGSRVLLGVSYSGVVIDGHVVTAELAGSALEGADASNHGRGHRYAGRDFVGATLVGILDNGTSLAVRIDDMDPNADGGAPDVHLYTASYATQDGYQPLCGLDASGNPVRAIALAGRWDYRVGVQGGGSHIDDPGAFTFACQGHALAKCVEFGYVPWDSIRACPATGDHHCPTTSLADMHQACTRAVRADYCGDGTSYTVDGTLIDVYDAYGYRTASPSLVFEAEWTTAGARCASRLRIPAQGAPACWSSLQEPACGATSDFSAGALLMTQDSP